MNRSARMTDDSNAVKPNRCRSGSREKHASAAVDVARCSPQTAAGDDDDHHQHDNDQECGETAAVTRTAAGDAAVVAAAAAVAEETEVTADEGTDALDCYLTIYREHQRAAGNRLVDVQPLSLHIKRRVPARATTGVVDDHRYRAALRRWTEPRPDAPASLVSVHRSVGSVAEGRRLIYTCVTVESDGETATGCDGPRRNADGPAAAAVQYDRNDKKHVRGLLGWLKRRFRKDPSVTKTSKPGTRNLQVPNIKYSKTLKPT